MHPDLRDGAKASDGRFRRSHFAMSKTVVEEVTDLDLFEEEEEAVVVVEGWVVSGNESLVEWIRDSKSAY